MPCVTSLLPPASLPCRCLLPSLSQQVCVCDRAMRVAPRSGLSCHYLWRSLAYMPMRHVAAAPRPLRSAHTRIHTWLPRTPVATYACICHVVCALAPKNCCSFFQSPSVRLLLTSPTVRPFRSATLLKKKVAKNQTHRTRTICARGVLWRQVIPGCTPRNLPWTRPKRLAGQ